MNTYRAATTIQRAWLYYLVRRADDTMPTSLCHPGPFCGDWLCYGGCQPRAQRV